MQTVRLNQDFIDKVKALCKASGISMTKLIADCGFNKNFVYDIEKRNAKPSIEILYKIANYFNVSTDYLLGLSDNPERR